MPGLQRLTFDIAAVTTQAAGGALAVTPRVGDESLVALVARFEAEKGFEPSGGYGGIVPRWFDYGDLRAYFQGNAERQWPSPDHLWLLGCGDCAEVGCWPFEARVIARHDTVTWTDFTQPHRPARDYTDFGPFTFARAEYERAVAWMADQVETHGSAASPDATGHK